ncbi:MAG: M23 family metallopeptidase [Bacteroidota bacterium]
MKRYFFLILAVLCVTVVYLSLEYNKIESGNHGAEVSQATVLQPDRLALPNHFSWLDSIYRNTSGLKTTYEIKRGDTFARILQRQGIARKAVNKITHLVSNQLDLSTFQVGKELVIYRDGLEEVPVKMEYTLSPTSMLVIDVPKASAAILEKEVITEVMSFHGNIITSVANTMQVKGLPTDLADKLLSIFAWDINFARLLKTDRVDMVYEAQIVDNEVIGSGKILAAVFTHKDKKYQAYYFEDDEVMGYFNEQGQNLSRAPLQFEMITSLYQKRRFHPVKRRYRAHLGMDFMADEGTPVTALKEGTIIAAGYRRANGNYVKIKHQKIITQYLHLSEIDPTVKVGKKITRGQPIGKVGSTGLSSGPHLCLRVWENGQQRDLLNYQFERNASITNLNRDAFAEVVSESNTMLQQSQAATD